MADTFVKDPDEELDYLRNWAPDFAINAPGDTIATSTWTADPSNPDTALTVGTTDHDDTTATIWVSGGTLGNTYGVTNEIVTAGGRTFNKTLRWQIRNK